MIKLQDILYEGKLTYDDVIKKVKNYEEVEIKLRNGKEMHIDQNWVAWRYNPKGKGMESSKEYKSDFNLLAKHIKNWIKQQ